MSDIIGRLRALHIQYSTKLSILRDDRTALPFVSAADVCRFTVLGCRQCGSSTDNVLITSELLSDGLRYQYDGPLNKHIASRE